MPPPHLPTLLIALLVAGLGFTVALALAERTLRAQPALRWWAGGHLAVLAAAVVGWLPLGLPDGVPVLAAYALLGLGLAGCHLAVQRLLGQAAGWRRVIVALVAWWLVLPWWPAWPPAGRSAVLSFGLAAMLLPSAWALARAARRQPGSLRTLLGMAVLAVIALLVRGAQALLAPEAPQDAPAAPGPGGALPLLATGFALLGGGVAMVLATAERVSRELAAAASHDGLTGCLNRSTTDALLVHALARARREGSPLAFALLDLDDLHRVNDQHGHRTGDEVLRAFAQAARARLRHADVIGRTGGDEFGLVLPATEVPGARRLVEDMRQATSALALRAPDGQPITVTLSAGIAVVAPDEVVSADRLFGRADQALYEAKCAGRNRVVCYGDSNPRQGVLIG